MFIEKVSRHIQTFNLNETDDANELRQLLDNPKVRIVDKARVMQTFESSDGDSRESHTEINILVEWEECSL